MKMSKEDARALRWVPLTGWIPHIGDLVRYHVEAPGFISEDPEAHVGVIVNSVQDHGDGTWYVDIAGSAGIRRTNVQNVYSISLAEEQGDDSF